MSPRKLRISDDLSLPLDLIVDRTAVLATTGAGKTYLTKVITEEVHKAGQQVVVLDPKGDFWGLRSSADGKSAGFPIPIFGGEHKDLPLEEGSGAFIAELIVKERLSAVLDLSLFSKSKMNAWATDFAERFYHRNREAMMLVIDEVHTFAPQKFKGQERMLGAFTDLVTKGRKRGIGTVIASQRSALVNKDVLDLTATLFVLRTGSDRDRTAIDGWLEYNASQEIRREIMESLAGLPTGEAWIYSPHTFNILKRITVREAETFDSSATPKPGQPRRKPKTLAEIDVHEVAAQMSEAIERAKADDPRELRRQIRILEDELKRAGEEAQSWAREADRAQKLAREPIEVEVIPEALHREIRSINAAVRMAASGVVTIEQASKRIEELMEGVPEAAARGKPRDRAATEGHSFGHSAGKKTTKPQVRGHIPADNGPDRITSEPRGKPRDRADTDGDLSTAERKILSVLANYPIGMTQRKLGSLTGYKPRGGALGEPLASLRRRGLVTSRGLELTDEGKRLTPKETLPRGRDLLEYWIERLSRGEARVLNFVYQRGPDLTTQEIADALGYSPRGGALGEPLAKLRARGLIVGSSGEIRCAEEFYE